MKIYHTQNINEPMVGLSIYGCCPKNRGIYPKMDGENNGLNPIF